jgi:hypothetical protein
MSTEADSKLTVLKDRLDDGEYRVDTKQVADAVLRSPLASLLLAVWVRRGTSVRRGPTAA